MAEKKPLKISYCTTCKDKLGEATRLSHLKQTLPANMAAEKNNPNVEFVVLDYGSDDNLAAWIKQNYQAEIDSGRLRYARYEAPHFKMAHAKNMAHRVATGDVLCNVDADNFIVKDFSKWLGEKFDKNIDSVVTYSSITFADDFQHKLKRLGGLPASVSGAGGRLAISRDNFNRLHGYDETYSAWGGDDYNLVVRAIKVGAEKLKIPDNLLGKVISHDHAERFSNMSERDKEISRLRLYEGYWRRNLNWYKRLLSESTNLSVNPDGNVGCGAVNINFSPEPIVIEPIDNSEIRVATNTVVAQASQGRIWTTSLTKQRGGGVVIR